MAEDSACRRWDESPPPSLEEEKEGEDDSYGAKANGESEGPRDELHYSVLRYDKSGDDFVFHVQVLAACHACLIRCPTVCPLQPLPQPLALREINRST